MKVLGALALLAIKEATRKKTFLILIIFAFVLVSSSLFFPVMEAQQRLKLVEIWSLRAITLFAALSCIFIAGVSIPQDVEEKRIYTLASKPVSRALIFLGKFLGFAIILALFVLFMGCVTIFFIKVVSGVLAEDISPRKRIYAKRFHGVGYKKRVVDGEEEYGLVDKEGVMLCWNFEGLDREKFEEQIQAEITISFSEGPFRYAGEIYLTIKDPEGKRSSKERYFIRTNAPCSFSFSRDFIGKKGGVKIAIERVNPQSRIIVKKSSLVLYTKSGSFELNYLKGLVLIFLQSLIVLSGAMMASSFLSAPVSIFLGLFIFFCGSSYGFIEDSIKVSENVLKYRQKDPHHGVHTRPGEISPRLIKISTIFSKAILKVMPDFREFDFSESLLGCIALSGRRLIASLLYAGLFGIAFVLIGIFAIFFRDFG